MNKLSIVKAPTGFGKTFGYVNVALSNNSNSKLVVAPTNALKDEIYNEVVKNFGTDNVKKTPILEKLKDKYGVSVYKLIHIAIKNVLKEYHEEKDINT